MADKKISELLPAGPLTGAELLPVVQSSQTRSTTISDLQEAQPVTYAEAMSLIGTSSLVPGKTYLLSDFRTKHYIVDSRGDVDLTTIVTGDLEPLILTAASTSEFSPVASSTTFPQDIIHIDLDLNNWLFDISFADVYGTGEIIPGFKGVIFYREDTKNNNIFNFDFRNCKSRRWKVIPNDWNPAVPYNPGDIVVYNNILYYATKTNTNSIPDDVNFIVPRDWLRVFNLSITRYISPESRAFTIPSHYCFGQACITVDSNDYQDFKMFVENGPTGTYEASVFSNKFGLTFKDQDNFYEWYGTLLPNNVIHLTDYNYYNLYGNKFEGLFYYNTFIAPEYFVQNKFLGVCAENIIYGESNFYNNLFSQEFEGNSIDSGFYDNTVIGNFNSNSISYTFRSNSISGAFDRNIASELYNNTFLGRVDINTILGIFDSNIVNDGFSGNTISSNCSRNVFQSTFNFNTLGSTGVSYFQNNIFEPAVTGLNFSAATHVYQAYNCTISRKPDNTFALSYINNSNAQVIVAATA